MLFNRLFNCSIGIGLNGIVTSRAFKVRKYTKGKPPIGYPVGGCTIAALSFIFALMTLV